MLTDATMGLSPAEVCALTVPLWKVSLPPETLIARSGSIRVDF